MATRSADATIKGYCYQFDKTILEILAADKGKVITIEGVEDVDVEMLGNDKAIQCKYIPSTKYSYSAIRKPIILMLEDHIARKAKGDGQLDYYLYAHYSDSGSHTPFAYTLDELKSVLTYTEGKKQIKHHELNGGIKDEILSEFLARFRYETGPSFEDQQGQVIVALQEEFGCGAVEADIHFYNNSLRAIRDLAVSRDIEGRKIKKEDFCRMINTKATVFDLWYFELKGEREYQKLVAERIKLAGCLNPQQSRFVFVGERFFRGKAGSISPELFIARIVESFFAEGKQFTNTLPFTVVVVSPKEGLAEIKKGLLRRNIEFNDGHEDLDFQPWLFNRWPVVNSQMSGKRATKFLGASSYQVRLIGADTFQRWSGSIDSPNTVFFFGDEEPSLYFPSKANLLVWPIHAPNLEGALKVLIKN